MENSFISLLFCLYLLLCLLKITDIIFIKLMNNLNQYFTLVKYILLYFFTIPKPSKKSVTIVVLKEGKEKA
jgi:hypothetical protein